MNDPFSCGTRIGNYEVLSRLGGEGATVYLVRQVFLQKRAVLKVFPSEAAIGSFAMSEFRREAGILASLNHPNLIRVNDFGEHAGFAYLLTEDIDGGTLEDRIRLRGGVLSSSEVLSLARGIAAGLWGAHGSGLAHRELRPASVLIGSDGVPKITDFALAKPVSKEVSADPSNVEESTLADPYAAPELRSSGSADSRSDVFSFGVIVHRILAGEFPETHPDGIVRVHASVDSRWVGVLARCLDPAPDRRFRDGGELLGALESLVDRPSSESCGCSRGWLWSLPIPLLSMAVFGALLYSHDAANPAGRSSVISSSGERMNVEGESPKSLDVRLPAGEAELGYGLVLQGNPARIVGWKPASRAIWMVKVRPGRYRVTCSYALLPALGAPPARVRVSGGEDSFECYLPVSSDSQGVVRARLGEIELSSDAKQVEVELRQGAADGTALRLNALFLEPLF